MNFKRFAAVFLLFWLFFIVILSLGISGAGYYLYKNLKSNIEDIEDSKISIIQSLADATVLAAAIDDENERKMHLDEFYTDPGNRNFYEKAFLVSDNGTIISHSNPSEAKDLNYNIAADEFRYNTDIIFEVLKKTTEKVSVNDYYIIGYDIPFSKNEIKYIKEYVYSGIDRNGWIVSRVFDVKTKKGQKTNYVSCFIVSKAAIYDEIINSIQNAKKSLLVISSVSFALAFIISFIVFIIFIISGKKSRIYESDFVTESNYYGTASRSPDYIDQNEIILYEDDESAESNIIIQDAIPIRKRR